MGRASAPLSKAMAYKPTVDPVILHGLFIFLIGLERNFGLRMESRPKHISNSPSCFVLPLCVDGVTCQICLNGTNSARLVLLDSMASLKWLVPKP